MSTNILDELGGWQEGGAAKHDEFPVLHGIIAVRVVESLTKELRVYLIAKLLYCESFLEDKLRSRELLFLGQLLFGTNICVDFLESHE